jgi:hypothetical protein
MSRPLSFEEVSAVLNSQGVPYNEYTVKANCDDRRNMCGCGKKSYRVDKYSVTQYDCGCGGKPQLPK